MKGFVPTPQPIVDLMVEKLFRSRRPRATDRLLDPGCGPGAFIEGVIRWCERRVAPIPQMLGIESDPRHVDLAARRFAGFPQVEIRHADFLESVEGEYDFILGNPPYVAITKLTVAERQHYRRRFSTASGRFDLYLLFFERALSLIARDGRLVFITPEKFLYVGTARPLRRLLAGVRIEELHFVPEDSFAGLVTYPLVTTVSAGNPAPTVRIEHRDGTTGRVALGRSDSSWLPRINGSPSTVGHLRLADICTRISCGVATGADGVFVVKDSTLEPPLREFAHPTISGRQIRGAGRFEPIHSLLVPYGTDGHLLDERDLGVLGEYLSKPVRLARLQARTCTARKPWYAFHETPPLDHLRRPKLLCKDITPTPYFVADETGEIIPRHSVYYVVPADPCALGPLQAYLNSDTAGTWLRANCQRAANGFLRMQSHVLKELPVPSAFTPGVALASLPVSTAAFA